jgi:hypothetical protein
MNAQQRGDAPASAWAPGDPWPVNWSGVWVGALAALAAALVFGLIGSAIGWHVAAPDGGSVNLVSHGEKKADITKIAVAYSIISAFFAFVIGGWVAVRVGGLHQSEPSMLHGAIAWLLSVPILLAAMVLGGGAYLGSWYNGLAGTPSWVPHPAVVAQADTDEARQQILDDRAKAARNASLMALTVLLVGLMGSVLGGWMGSGEPMTFGRWHSNSSSHQQQRALTTEGAQITVRDTGPPAERTAV